MLLIQGASASQIATVSFGEERPAAMGSTEDADNAIRELNGYEMDGRQLNVNEARERTGGGGGRRF